MAVEAGQPRPELTCQPREASARGWRISEATLWFCISIRRRYPGCTKEAQGFAEAYPEFQGSGIEVVGVSKDERRHQKLKTKYGLHARLRRERRGGRGLRILGREEQVRQDVHGHRSFDLPDRR